jgi:hypothetical protein
MTLRACSHCRRHFAAEPACPFCGAASAAPPPTRVTVGGRLSRAAAFAALAGCYTSNPPPQYGPPPPPPPPPHEQQQQQQQQVTEDQQKFAKPPDAGTSAIQGTLKNSQSAAPLANWPVQLQSPSQPSMQPRNTQTDANGHYAFVDLPAGDYVLVFGYDNHPRRRAPRQNVTLGDHDAKTVDQQIFIPPPSNIPMPYGAPPARGRVV